MLDVTYLLVDSNHTLDNSPVLQSQVLDWVIVQNTNGIKVGLVCAIQDNEKFELVAGSKLREAGIPYKTFIHGDLFHNILNARKTLKLFCLAHSPINIYVRGIWGALVYRMTFIKRGLDCPRLIYDFRGDVVSESTLNHEESGNSFKNKSRKMVLGFVVKSSIRSADIVCAVSNSAANFVRQQYKCRVDEVIPSGVNHPYYMEAFQKRELIRKELGITEDQVLIVYSGGLSKYQMIPDMLSIWKRIQMCDRIKFLLMTTDVPSDTAIIAGLREISSEKITTKSLPRQSVAEYLSACDIGFLLRKDDAVNKVASPVKLGEYLSSGLSVVTSPGIGESSDLVSNNNVGILVTPGEFVNSADRCLNFARKLMDNRIEYRNRSWELSRKYIDWESHLDKWKNVIKSPVT